MRPDVISSLTGIGAFYGWVLLALFDEKLSAVQRRIAAIVGGAVTYSFIVYGLWYFDPQLKSFLSQPKDQLPLPELKLPLPDDEQPPQPSQSQEDKLPLPDDTQPLPTVPLTEQVVISEPFVSWCSRCRTYHAK